MREEPVIVSSGVVCGCFACVNFQMVSLCRSCVFASSVCHSYCFADVGWLPRHEAVCLKGPMRFAPCVVFRMFVLGVLVML